MQSHLSGLLELQKAEKAITALQRQLESLPQEEAERRQVLEKEKDDYEQALATAKEARMQSDEMELEIRSREEEMLKVEGQLNTAKSNAEYTAFQNQAKRLKKEISDLEDRGLAVMDEIETLKERAGEQEKRYRREEQIFQEFLEKSKQEKARIQEEIGKLRQEIVGHEKRCDPVVLAEYKQLAAFFSSRGGNVLSPVKGTVCSACGSRVLPNDQVNLSRGKILVKCKTCSRILYIPGRMAVN